MTPSEIELYARQRYNAVGDTTWSQAEILSLITEASSILARKAYVIERVYSTTTVAGQQEYSFPSSTISIKRVTFDGRKLTPITFREDDALTLDNSATAATGTPQFYAQFNDTLYLRSVPSTAGTLQIFAYKDADAVALTSALEVPTRCHIHIASFILAEMYGKDENPTMMDRYAQRWQDFVDEEVKLSRKRKRADAFSGVQDEETLARSVLGPA